MDFITDRSGRHLLRIHNTVAELPDFVKEAAIDDSVVATLPITAFADQAKREFPMNNPANIFLSYAYAKSANVENPRLIARLKQAADKSGLTPALETIDAAFGAVKQASTPAERNFALRIDFDAELNKSANAPAGVQGFYPINTAEEIKASAVELDNHKNRIPLTLYVEGARELVKAAGDTGVALGTLPQRIVHYGQESIPNFEHISWEAARRVEMTGDPIYAEIVKSAQENEENMDMQDYAKAWELADWQHNVIYAASIPDPYRVFNVGLAKQAYTQEMQQHVLIAGAVVPVQAVAEVDTSEVAKWFPKGAGDTITRMVKKAANGLADDVILLVGDLSVPAQQSLLRLILAE